MKLGAYWNGLVGYNTTHNLEAFHELYTHEVFEYPINPKLPWHPQGQISFAYVVHKTKVKCHIHPPLYNSILKVKQHIPYT